MDADIKWLTEVDGRSRARFCFITLYVAKNMVTEKGEGG
jgi:hypothetical protein